MRRIVLAGLLLAAGCAPFRGPAGIARPGVGVLVKGAGGRCAPVVVGATVRRVCLPPAASVDSAAADTLGVTR